MAKEFVETLNITNVYQKKKYDRRMAIYFTIEGFHYRLYAEKQEYGIFYPTDVLHQEHRRECNYCDKVTICPGLKVYLLELFHRLIEHPSIRLEWLYINHV